MIVAARLAAAVAVGVTSGGGGRDGGSLWRQASSSRSGLWFCFRARSTCEAGLQLEPGEASTSVSLIQQLLVTAQQHWLLFSRG